MKPEAKTALQIPMMTFPQKPPITSSPIAQRPPTNPTITTKRIAIHNNVNGKATISAMTTRLVSEEV